MQFKRRISTIEVSSVLLDHSIEDSVLDLDRRDRVHFLCATNGVRGAFRQTKILDFARSVDRCNYQPYLVTMK